jgi:hypothetical protein
MPENSKKPGIKAIVRMISPTGTIPPDHPYVQMMKQRYGVNVDIRVFKTEEEAVADAEKNPPEMEENSETDPMARMLSDSAVPPSLAELAAMLAAGINEKMQQEEARQKQPPPTSWGDFLRFKLRNCQSAAWCPQSPANCRRSCSLRPTIGPTSDWRCFSTAWPISSSVWSGRETSRSGW